MYRYLDHPSEALIEILAINIEEVFQDAARALFEIMTDTSRVQPERAFEVELKSEDRVGLLIDWLNRLILLHEVNKVFLSQFEVDVRHNAAWSLKARVKGEPIRDTHERRSEVKSATFGQFQWSESSDGHRVQFVLDI